MVREIAEVNEAAKAHFDERSWPMPDEAGRGDDFDDGLQRADLEAEFAEPARDREGDVGFAALGTPALHDRSDELFEFRAGRGETERRVIEVLVQDQCAAWP